MLTYSLWWSTVIINCFHFTEGKYWILKYRQWFSLQNEWSLPVCRTVLTVRAVKFLQHCCWGFRSSGMWRCAFGWVVPDVSKGRSASSFKCEGGSPWCALYVQVVRSKRFFTKVALSFSVFTVRIPGTPLTCFADSSFYTCSFHGRHWFCYLLLCTPHGFTRNRGPLCFKNFVVTIVRQYFTLIIFFSRTVASVFM